MYVYIYTLLENIDFKIPWIGHLIFLTEEPDSKIKLAAGFGRHWPDARGVFVCEAWCSSNEKSTVVSLGYLGGWNATQFRGDYN